MQGDELERANPGTSLKLRLTPPPAGCFNRSAPRRKVLELTVDALPDFASLSDDDLARLLRDAEEEEEAISRAPRTSTARIDLLRERARRAPP